MDLSNFTTKQLWELYYQIGWEVCKRQWWQFTLVMLSICVIYAIVIISQKKKSKNYYKHS